MCRDQDTPGWLQQHDARLPKQLRTLIDHENKAVTISDFEATLVPGLLQTSEYARAVIRRIANVPSNEVDDRVAARLARQSVFSRDRPARFTFYLHEPITHFVKQLISRIDDDLHRRLKERAAKEGRSVNDLVTEVLATAVLDRRESFGRRPNRSARRAPQ